MHEGCERKVHFAPLPRTHKHTLNKPLPQCLPRQHFSIPSPSRVIHPTLVTSSNLGGHYSSTSHSSKTTANYHCSLSVNTQETADTRKLAWLVTRNIQPISSPHIPLSPFLTNLSPFSSTSAKVVAKPGATVKRAAEPLWKSWLNLGSVTGTSTVATLLKPPSEHKISNRRSTDTSLTRSTKTINERKLRKEGKDASQSKGETLLMSF